MDPFATNPASLPPDRFRLSPCGPEQLLCLRRTAVTSGIPQPSAGRGASFADTTVAIAASYEAKALGIKTGTRVSDMKRICPDIIMVHGSHTTYAEYSHRIAAAVELVCPVAHTPSIDEMVCQLIGREQEPPRARQIALEIKRSIQDKVGETLRCSIGMAPNRYLAKIASDMQKPDGLIGLLPSQLPRALMHLELRDLPGVGARTEQMLIGKASPPCRSCWLWTVRACISYGTPSGATGCTTGCTVTARATMAPHCPTRCRSPWVTRT